MEVPKQTRLGGLVEVPKRTRLGGLMEVGRWEHVIRRKKRGRLVMVTEKESWLEVVERN